MMPATCLVEVESRKGKEGLDFIGFVGNGPFSLNYSRTCKCWKWPFGHIRLMTPLHGSWIFWGELHAVHHLSLMKNGRNILPAGNYCTTTLKRHGKKPNDRFSPSLLTQRKAGNDKGRVHELHWFKRSIRGLIACRLIRWNMKVRKKMKERKNHLPNRIIP